jgi:hypothetical protein
MTFKMDIYSNCKNKAISELCRILSLTPERLGRYDVDYRLTKNGVAHAYAEVKIVDGVMKNAFPLKMSAKKLVKLMDKRLSGVAVWACKDGVIYANAKKADGVFRWGESGNANHKFNDNEFMVYFNKSNIFRYINYHG